MMIDTLKQDLHYSLRSLLAKPGFLIAAVLTLALGIGANVAIFSVVNALLIKPLPFPDSQRLVMVHNAYPAMGLDNAGSSIPDYLERRDQVTALADLALYAGANLNLASEGAPQRLVGVRATPSLFSTLQTAPALGRVFDDQAAVPGQDRVLVISHGLWQSQFAGDPGIIGRDIRLNGESHRVIGVMPAGFVFPNPETQAWLPYAFTPEQMSNEERGNEYSESIGRLAPGATAEQAQAQMDAIIRRNADLMTGAAGRAGLMAEMYRNGGFAGRTKPLREHWVGDVRAVLWLLQAVAAFVLLIACANVANLMLTRVSARQKELAVRSALGAGRRRIIRQLLIESTLLATIGAVAGVVVAFACLQLLEILGLAQSPLQARIGIDAPVVVFTFALALVTGIVFGLFPAFAQSSARVFETLKESGRGNAGSRKAHATRSALVVVQIALCVTLLVGAGLLLRSFDRIQSESPGFERDGRVTVRLALSETAYPEDGGIERFFERALAELRAITGVTGAAYASHLPFGPTSSSTSFQVEGKPSESEQAHPHGYWRIADDHFFQTMDIPLLAGRHFNPSDSRDGSQVVIVDELLARKHFGDESAIGQRIRAFGDRGDSDWWTIVGVVGSVKQDDLGSDIAREMFYFPIRQFPFSRFDARGGYFVITTDLPTGALVPQIRAAVLRVDPDLPVFDIKTLDERIALSLQGRQAPMLLLLLFAGVALLLSAVGVYGVLAYSVEQRTGELGVRMAIGARAGNVIGMVLKQGGRMAAIGIGLGLLGALALGGALGSQLFGISRFDPMTFAGVVLVLGMVVLVACWLPAWRASRVSPMVALRYE